MNRDYTKDKNATKSSRIGLWELGCAHCKKSFADDENFICIDIDDCFNDEAYGFHKDCFGSALPALHLSKD